MGAVVSAGVNNDDLIENLKDANYIKSTLVYQSFRAVDRGEYFIPERHINPYRDVAWKSGNLHISAPCIYSKVLEGLQLRAGHSFLNLGSGTGYLNTVAGLILGHSGINHGIEVHEEVVQYAMKKLEDFKRYSGAVDQYDFCEPKFIHGNCLCIASGCHLYDRVYCGAACPDQYLSYLKNLIKVGGILIVPLNEQLLQMDRISETEWNTKALLPVSFASLIHPRPNGAQEIQLPSIEPLSLQELCRAKVRDIMRKVVEIEHPTVKVALKLKKMSKKKKKQPKRSSVPHTFRGREELFDYFLLTMTRRKQRSTSSSSTGTRTSQSANEATPDTTETVEETESVGNSTSNNLLRDSLSGMKAACVDILNSVHAGLSSEGSNTTEEPCHLTTAEVTIERMDIHEDSVSDTEKTVAQEEQPSSTEEQVEEEKCNNVPHLCINVKAARSASPFEEEPCCSEESKRKKRNTREKFDSGLGDEIISESSNIQDDNSDVDSSSYGSSDEEYRNTYGDARPKRSAFSLLETDADSSDPGEFDVEAPPQRRMYKSPYSEYMVAKIRDLPLPHMLKNYINFYREL